MVFFNLSVTRQKVESQNGGNKKKTKRAKFHEKQTFLTPDTHTYVCVSGSKKCSFFEKFGMLCFLVTSVLRFALLPYHRLINISVITVFYELYFVKMFFKSIDQEQILLSFQFIRFLHLSLYLDC